MSALSMNDMNKTVAGWCLISTLLLFSTIVHGGALLVGPGAMLDSGSGHLDLGCSQLRLAGSLRGEVHGTGHVQIEPGGFVQTDELSFSGDWTNGGNPIVSGQVRWLDGCNSANASMLGNSDFDRLEISSTSGATRRLDVSGLQFVESLLTLAGTADQLMVLRSTQPGQRAGLLLSTFGSQAISSLDVADIDASGGQVLAPGAPEESGSLDSGNNVNWFIVEVIDSIFRSRFETP